MAPTDESEPSSPKLGVQHKKHDVYSENLPIPSIQRFFRKGLREVIAQPDDDDDELESVTDVEGEEEEGKINPESHSQQQPTGKAKTEKRGKTRIVDDPITRKKVAIHDVSRDEYARAMKAGDEANRRHSRSSSKNEPSAQDFAKENGTSQGKARTAKRFKESTNNVLCLPFPPEDVLPAQIWNIHPLLLPLFVVWSIITSLRLCHPAVSVVTISWLAWWGYRCVQSRAEDSRWERERRRGEAARRGYYNEADRTREEDVDHGVTESGEWLNAIVESLWSVLNSDLFASLGGTLEDVLQASTHGQALIQAVKVEDLAQGSTPIRLTGFRVLADDETVELRRAALQAMEERNEKETQVRSSVETSQYRSMPTHQDEKRAEKSKSEQAKEADGGEGGTYINLELSFVYRARPTSSTANVVASKSRNAHLLIKFWIGARKLYTVPLPVWVEFKGLVGKVRARVQLTPDPPFIKNVTFSLMGLPRTEVSVIPLRINTQNIPFLSSFIQKSVSAAIGEYCAPSSMTLDVGEMLMGDSIKREVNAMGVVLVYIHRAFDLEKQDVTGSSDPYCTVSLKKYGKILYCTRVALDDLSPRWEERCFIMVSPEAVRAREKVRISLWDSDRMSADDILGQAEVDLQSLVRRPGRVFRRTDALVGLRQDMKKQGTIQWSLVYYKKVPNVRGSMTQQKGEQDHAQGGEDIEDHEEEQAKSSDVGEEQDENLDEGALDWPEEDGQQTRNKEAGVSFEPPNSSTPTGILSMQVHQIAQLELIDTKTHFSSRKSLDTAQKVETVEDEQEQSFAPSSYVTIVLNDETVFRSRQKAFNSNPFFNAGSERLVTDWERTMVMFVVWDARLREEDAILGVVPLKLCDVFRSSSQVTQFFPIGGGVGRGKIRISLLFRPLQDTSRRKEKLGWNIGTMRVLSSPVATDFTRGFSPTLLRLVSVRARTLAGAAKIPARRCSLTDKSDDAKSVEWTLHKNEFPCKVPVRRRYSTPFIIEFRILTALGTRKTVSMSVIWLQDISDDDEVDHKLPIWRPKEGSDFHRLLQNYHDYRKEHEAEALGVERVGYLHVRLQFKSGAGRVHMKFSRANPDVKEVMQAWECCAAAGLRSIGGDFVDKKENEEDAASPRMGSTDDSDDNDDDDDDNDDNDDQNEEGIKGNGHRRSGSIGEDESDDGLVDKFRKWKEERKELGRQQRGMKQFKVVRTASWLKKGVQQSGSRAVNSMRLQDRRFGQVESEL